ncbi:cysteine desulfurase NifS [Neobacillus piezotolerans]|uniref:Cysteine desulfurase NifS n=1 Tax=Neobacillus piezotolerans TaxID=2259171 RepID=A0A3D8GP40_9BACI|nr:cysteine desulfurase family protein [Neobacillus piezotolerans]RDU36188.1 cysteine desulfurase NifS [Neobacillus piezotolerans]
MIYFDNSATTKPYKEVLESFWKVSEDFFGNPSSLHGIGGKTERLLSQARAQIAGLLGVDAEEITFTSGGTESNNLAIKGTAFGYKNRGRHLITTAVEHASVRESMHQLEKHGFSVTFVPVDKEGRVNPEDIRKSITDETILVSVMHVNNEVGTIQPIMEIGEIVRAYPKVLFHVDGVQGAGKLPLDLKKAGVDMYSFSAHKFHGLKGSGGLYVKKGIKLEPVLSGGSQESGRRGGTENPAGAVAMAKALRISLDKRADKYPVLLEIRKSLVEGLGNMAGIIVNTPNGGAAPHIINFSVPGIKSETFVHALEEQGIYLSTTSACSSKKKSASSTLIAMNVPDDVAGSAVRISLSYENTLGEAIEVLKEIEKTVSRLGRVLN